VEQLKEFPFVGRVAEIAHCMRLLGKTPAIDESLTILVTGELGIGKTRFLQEMVPWARASGYRVLLHHCQEWNRYQPFDTLSTFLRLLFGKPSGWTPRSIETMINAISQRFPQFSLNEQEKELLYWLFGGSKVSKRTKILDERSRRGMITTLFGKILQQQIQQQPFLLLALDDIHQSDSLSADYLLSANLGKGTVLMTSALSVASPPVQRDAKEVSLLVLGKDEVKQLLLAQFGLNFQAERFVPELLRITGGNPLHLVQLLALVPVDEVPAARLTRILEAKRPSEAFEAAVQRLQSLNAPSLRLITSASLIEDSFPIPILKRVMGARFPLKTVLRNLRRHSIVRVESHRGRNVFHFEHGIVREAAYSLLDEVKKKHLHAAAAAALKRFCRGSVQGSRAAVRG
jgi:predicted ATPase